MLKVTATSASCKCCCCKERFDFDALDWVAWGLAMRLWLQAAPSCSFFVGPAAAKISEVALLLFSFDSRVTDHHRLSLLLQSCFVACNVRNAKEHWQHWWHLPKTSHAAVCGNEWSVADNLHAL